MIEAPEAVVSETEKEIRRREIIARLLVLEKQGVNGENWQEVQALEQELPSVSPITNDYTPEVISNERRRSDADREAINKVLNDAKKFKK